MAVGTVKATPTKAFFVRMLTRDISLDDCILDLIDNSIDGAWKSSEATPSSFISDEALADFRIDIAFSEEKFVITDNCGGIDLNTATDYAFTFGRVQPPDQVEDESQYTVGVYGIGMKRAVFKIGNTIRVSSTYAEDGSLAAFLVPINVPNWLVRNVEKVESWDFDLDEMEPAAEPGVAIEITELLPETRARFADPTYARRLRRILGRDYMLPLMRGLTITVNGEDVIGLQIDYATNVNFAPMRDGYDDENVQVEIFAGMVSVPPDDWGPSDEREGSNLFGWYVLCNGRVVLAADKGPTTGWGVDLPQWHRQYDGFVGLMLFSSDRPSELPMTTTKRNVDTSSGVFRRAVLRVRQPARSWIDYTNARKNDAENVKAQFEVNTAPIPIESVASRPVFQLPTVAKPASRIKMANLNFAVPLRRLRALAAAFGEPDMSYKDVGISSFDFAYEQLVSDDGE